MTELERALAACEAQMPITNDADLLAALDFIIEKEEKKRNKWRNYDLLNEAISAKLTVLGYDVERLGKRGEEIARAALAAARAEEESAEKRSSIPRLRLMARAVPVAVLLIILLVVSTGAAKGFFLTKYQIETMEPGKVYDIDGSEVIISKDVKFGIKTLDDLAKLIDDPDVLLPYGLDSSYTITYMDFADYVLYKESIIKLSDNSGESVVHIQIGKQWEVELDTERIGIFNVHLSHYDDIYQGEFEYADSMYLIKAESQEKLYYIIESMRTDK